MSIIALNYERKIKTDIEATYRHGVLTLTVPKKALEKRVPEKNLIAIEIKG